MNNWPVEGIPALIPNRTRVIIIYPTVDPQVVVVPIVSSIFLFPIIVLLIICWLRKMAAKRRQRARLAHRDDYWNERSCASIVQRSPPLSISLGNGNGCGTNRFGTIDIELATTTLDIVTPHYAILETESQLIYPNSINNINNINPDLKPNSTPS